MPADGERLIVAPRWDWYSFTQLVMCQITGKTDLSTVEHYIHRHTHTPEKYLAAFLVFLLTVVWTARIEAKHSVCLTFDTELFTSSFAKHVWTLLSVNTHSILWDGSVFYHPLEDSSC